MFRAAMGHFLVHFLGYSLFAVWVSVWVKVENRSAEIAPQ